MGRDINKKLLVGDNSSVISLGLEKYFKWWVDSRSGQFILYYAAVTNNPKISVAYHTPEKVYFLHMLFVEGKIAVVLLRFAHLRSPYLLHSNNWLKEQLLMGNHSFIEQKKRGRNFMETRSIWKCLVLIGTPHSYSHFHS